MNEFLPIIEQWLSSRLRRPPRRYGRGGANYEGFSDGIEGVQWNAGIERDRKVITVGVNLEGMKYCGWPIATLLLRERRTPLLPELLRRMPDAASVEVWLERDAWQAAARLPIAERFIGPPGPVAAASLNDETWATMVREALLCLDGSRRHKGRGTQTVTLSKVGQRQKAVSPHLQIKLPMPPERLSPEALEAAACELEPVHQWLTSTAAG